VTKKKNPEKALEKLEKAEALVKTHQLENSWYEDIREKKKKVTDIISKKNLAPTNN